METIYNEYERLGGPYEGSYATVYKVRHVKYGYVRALKVLKDSIASESDKKYQTFLKECMMLLRIGNGSHPNIVRIYQPRLINNQAMVEMDYINGVELQKYLEQTKFMSIDEVYRFIRQIGGALAYCHRDIYRDQLDWDADNLECDPQDGTKPLIDAAKESELVLKYRVTHNDLHSCNVMRRHYDGNFVLLDFGLAIQNGTAVKSSSLRQGAPEYKSPEKWNGDDVETPQNDIYSFGVLLYEVLTGQPPFPLDRNVYNSHPEKAIVDVENRHLHEKPAPIEPKRKAAFQAAHPGKAWQRDYPAWLEQMVMKCLAKKPKDRYADAKELIEDFNRHLAADEAARNKAQRVDQSSQQQTAPRFVNTDVNSFLQSGHNYLNAKNYGEAVKNFRLAAELGSAEAQNMMGRCYQEGWGVPKEPAIAIEWFRKAADQGNASAQYNLGYCYEHGNGVDKNYSEAVKWYRESAGQGNASAQKALDRLTNNDKQQASQPKQTLLKQPQNTGSHTKTIKYSILAAVALAIIAYLVYSGGGVLTGLWKSENPVADSLCLVGHNYLNGESGCPQDFTEAVNHFRQAAELGSAEAQNMMGRCYQEGWGVPKDSVEGVEWYRKAADQGYEWGQYNLGYCYYYGQGIEQDYKEAAKWYRKAAKNDNPNAQDRLGDCYYAGEGVDQNYKEAVKWYRKAADQGFARAQYNLGFCYYNGNGVDQNYGEAVKWYRKAADQGNASAQCSLGTCYCDGNGVDQNYGEAVKWYRKAADQGNVYGQYSLGYCYHNGKGVDKNDSEAAKWYRKAADQGNADAQNMLGRCYREGWGVAKNYPEAVKWYLKAAEQNHASAQYNLGFSYEYGEGVKQDYSEAAKWYRKAADQGDADAQNMLGRCYCEGWGVTKNYPEAVKWYLKAAEQNHASAQYNLGFSYEYGEGVAKNQDEAINWYRKAAEQGHSAAKAALKRLGVND